MNPKVDEFLRTEKKWGEEFKKLREIILACQLTEDLKWGVPCYTFKKKNIVLIHGFKEYCAVLFMKGTLLKDEKGMLIAQTENVQSSRQIRFTTVQEIITIEPILKSYLYETIEVEKANLKVDFKKKAELTYPDEFQHKLDAFPALKIAFDALTPGRQRGYNLYFSEAKQSKTREARIEKCMPQILKGMGLNE